MASYEHNPREPVGPLLRDPTKEFKVKSVRGRYPNRPAAEGYSGKVRWASRHMTKVDVADGGPIIDDHRWREERSCRSI